MMRYLTVLIPVVGIGISAHAAELDIPNTFTPGTPAVAAEVNANFAAVETAVDDNAASIVDLQARIASLEADNAALQNIITQVLPYLQGGIDANGNPTIFFSGANVHIDNGAGQTDSVNGLGNLIIGYDESADPAFVTEFCSNGDYDNSTDCTNNGGVWDINQKTGSHNVVIGNEHSYTRYGGLVAGYQNTITGINATVSGGWSNNARGLQSNVGGGALNTAGGTYASVSGGYENMSTGNSAAISGGRQNTASGSSSSISGGYNNTASGSTSSISGGWNNTASQTYTSVSGGTGNTASGNYSSVSGGLNRSATDTNDWVAGGLTQDQ